MAHPTWPLYDLVVRTPMLELRLPNEDEMVALVRQTDDRIYERTGRMPFSVDWTGDHRSSMQFFWRARANWTADDWHLPLAVFVDGAPVGVQGIHASRFGALRRVDTGSWLLPDAQGRGLGTEMRIAVLAFAFAGLGALEAHSGAHVDNEASNAVSRKLGYTFTHRELMLFGDERAEQWHMVLTRDDWEAAEIHRRDDIVIEHLDPVGDWFVAET